MNILFLLSQLEITGAEVYATTLSDWYIDKGHKVFIISDTLTKSTKAEYYPLDFNNRTLPNRHRHLRYLLKFIKKNKIDIIHANSRASGYIGHFASRISGIPMITTIHGVQPVHLSRKIFKNFGDRIIVICENLFDQMINDFKIDKSQIELIRNGFFIQNENYSSKKENNKICILGRLSGPKKDVALKVIEKFSKMNLTDYEICLVGGKELPKEFEPFKNNFNYYVFQKSLIDSILKSKLIICSGRIAIEGILHNIPVVAVGESTFIGNISDENLDLAFRTNFGDIQKPVSFDWSKFEDEFNKAVISKGYSENLLRKIKEEFDINIIGEKILKIYRKEIIRKRKYEIPVLMYHRVIENMNEAGKTGIYITKEIFEKHLAYLKKNNYTTITFKELANIDITDKNKKYIILTFDDGYEDNYKVLFPLLKKYDFKCVIFLVSDLEYNEWDFNNTGDMKLALLKEKQLLEMQKYGIEFGAHTMTHKNLTKISLDEAKKEIVDSKLNLKKKLNTEIISFAYPYGAYNDKIKKLVIEAGFKYAVATDNGPLFIEDDLFEIRRINVFDNTNLFRFRRKVSGYYNFLRVKRENKKTHFSNQ